MNLKKAKFIRKWARYVAQLGQFPERQYLQHTKSGVIVNDPQSFRGLYRQMKKDKKDVAITGIEGPPSS